MLLGPRWEFLLSNGGSVYTEPLMHRYDEDLANVEADVIALKTTSWNQIITNTDRSHTYDTISNKDRYKEFYQAGKVPCFNALKDRKSIGCVVELEEVVEE